jgi:hypothetical protein
LYANYVTQHRETWGLPAAAPAVPPVAAAPEQPAPPTRTAKLEPGPVLASVAPMAAAEPPPPLPRVRPSFADRLEPLAALNAPTEKPAAPEKPIEKPSLVEKPAEKPAPIEKPVTTTAVAPGVPYRHVPPAASVLPNIDFPSSASIPAISIIAAEPKLPAPEKPAAAAASSTAPKASSPKQ